MADKGLHCPECDSFFKEDDSPGILICNNDHRFNIADLMIKQTARIRQLLNSAITMLNEQMLVLIVSIEEIEKDNDPANDAGLLHLTNALVDTDYTIQVLTEFAKPSKKKRSAKVEPEPPLKPSDDIKEDDLSL